MKRMPLLFLALLLCTLPARAASVGPGGYTNDFSAWPLAADWATLSIPGSPGEVYDLDNDVLTNALYSAANISLQTISNATAAPTVPAQLTNAVWNGPGGFLQTRPNTTRATALMGKFVNNTGSNAASVQISYLLSIPATAVIEDAGKGTHVYFSLSGTAGSWTPVPSLFNTNNTGTNVMSATVTVFWPDGASLHLLWVDDNTTTGVDPANQLDNFSLAVIPAVPGVTLLAPTNGAAQFFNQPLPLVADTYAGPGLTTTGVGFYDVATGFITNKLAAPYTNSVLLAPGGYALYAVATNNLGGTLYSPTNTVTLNIPPTNTVPPAILGQVPVAGASMTNLVSLQVFFTEIVTNVNAADLRVNGNAATNVTGGGSNYVFTFPTPAAGTVTIQFAPGHGIVDFGYPAGLPFDENGAGASWTYTLLDVGPPLISARVPAAGASVTNLTQVAVTFNEPVTGVDAADFRVNGVAATGVSGGGANYTFTFPVPSGGPIAITWAAGHGITDSSSNPFNPATAGHTWNYTQVDGTPPTVLSQTPVAGSFVASLTSLTVNFSESVTGVNAADLRVNGVAATAVSGGPANYTFTVPLLNATTVDVTWTVGHGINDLAAPANGFNASGPGATWSYTTTDTAPPVATVFPTPSLAVARLTHLNVSFNEPVTGVNAADLLINGAPATNVAGFGAGPYLFTFPEPPTGSVSVAWAPGHGIADQAAAPNAFAGGAWSYTLNPALLGDFVVRHVVQMSLDGLAAVHLRFYVTNAPGQFPNFVRLMNEGAWTMNARCDFEYSETVPNHSTMFMARPVAQPAGAPNTVHHGYNNNFPAGGDTFHNSGNLNVPYKSSMMDVAHDYGRGTALYTGKTRLDICDRSYNAANGAPDLIGADNGTDKIDFSSVLDLSGNNISNGVNTLLADLTGPSPKNYSFIHIAEPDLTGHSSGWGSANWSNAVRNVDTQIGRILNALDTTPALSNQSAFIVTADHGGGGVIANAHTEAYHPNNFTIPFFVRAPGVRPGLDAYALFANRGNPGTNRTDYNTQPQPVRNGDASNLALSFLGLPPIPGSSIVPALNTPLNTLRVARFGPLSTVFWYDPNNGSVLEAASDLTAPAWQTVTNGIVTSESTKSFSVTNGVGALQFFRVRKL